MEEALPFLNQKVQEGKIWDVRVRWVPETQPAMLGFGHRIEVPQTLQDSYEGIDVLDSLRRRLIQWKVQTQYNNRWASVLYDVQEGFFQDYFPPNVAMEERFTGDLMRNRLQFALLPKEGEGLIARIQEEQQVSPLQQRILGQRRWFGALNAHLADGLELSQECVALEAASAWWFPSAGAQTTRELDERAPIFWTFGDPAKAFARKPWSGEKRVPETSFSAETRQWPPNPQPTTIKSISRREEPEIQPSRVKFQGTLNPLNRSQTKRLFAPT